MFFLKEINEHCAHQLSKTYSHDADRCRLHQTFLVRKQKKATFSYHLTKSVIFKKKQSTAEGGIYERAL